MYMYIYMYISINVNTNRERERERDRYIYIYIYIYIIWVGTLNVPNMRKVNHNPKDPINIEALKAPCRKCYVHPKTLNPKP